jgi:hypothetical protein
LRPPEAEKTSDHPPDRFLPEAEGFLYGNTGGYISKCTLMEMIGSNAERYVTEWKKGGWLRLTPVEFCVRTTDLAGK